MSIKLIGAIVGYVIAMTAANLFFKFSAESHGKMFWVYFFLGNAVGFVCTLFLPMALRLAPAGVVYAMAIGGGCLALQLTTFVLFPQPTSFLQVTGITLVTGGLILLYLGQA